MYLPLLKEEENNNRDVSSKEHGTFQILPHELTTMGHPLSRHLLSYLHLKPRPKKKKQRNSPKDSEAASVVGPGVLKSALSPASPRFFILHRDAPVLDLEEIQETASASQEALLFTFDKMQWRTLVGKRVRTL